MAEGLSRRTILHGLTGSAVAAGSLPWVVSSASAAPGKLTDPATDWAAYGRAVGSAFDRMRTSAVPRSHRQRRPGSAHGDVRSCAV